MKAKTNSTIVNVLFVCMGNICRSPTAHGVFRAMVRDQGLEEVIVVDSAGTHAYHVGNPPDPRSAQAARTRGYDLDDLRARRVGAMDFQRFDYVLAMDSDNYMSLRALCPPEALDRLSMFLDFAPELDRVDVPDPYYGGPRGFEEVLDLVEAASRGLLDHIRTTRLQAR